MCKLCTLCHFFFIITLCFSAQLPSTFKKCDRNSNDFKQCLVKAVQDAVGQLTKPIKEVGLPSIDPLLIPAMTIAPGSGPTNFGQNYKNMKVSGYSKGTFTKFDVDFKKNVITFECTFPQVKMDFDYDINGKVLVLPLYGEGPGSITLDELLFNVNFNLEEYEKKGAKHYKITSSKLKMKPKLIHFKLDNLFNGDKALGENINKVMNDNWQALFEDVQGSYEEAFNTIFTSIFNKFLEKVPISEIF